MGTRNDVLLEQIEAEIGREALIKLIQAMPGERIRIPTDDEWMALESRNRAIREAFYTNHDIPWIQQNIVPLSRSQIYRIIKAAQP